MAQEFKPENLKYKFDHDHEGRTALGRPAYSLTYESSVAYLFITLPDTKEGYKQALKARRINYHSDGYYMADVGLLGSDKPTTGLHYIPLGEKPDPLLFGAARRSDLANPMNARAGSFKDDPDPDYRLLWAALEEADRLVRELLPGYHLL